MVLSLQLPVAVSLAFRDGAEFFFLVCQYILHKDLKLHQKSNNRQAFKIQVDFSKKIGIEEEKD